MLHDNYISISDVADLDNIAGLLRRALLTVDIEYNDTEII